MELFFLLFVSQSRSNTLKEIRRELQRSTFIMTKKEAGIQIDKQIIRRTVPFHPKIREQYDQAEENLILNDEMTVFNCVAYSWMRKLCGGFIEDNFVWNGKLMALNELLYEELPDQKIIIWCHFNAEVETITKTLQELGKQAQGITGKVKFQDRGAIIEEWKRGSTDCLILQQAIAQTGLNLSEADAAIIYSPTPSLSASVQYLERTVDVTCKRRPVYIYLQVEDSLDQDIYQALEMKKLTSNLTLNTSLKDQIQKRRKHNAMQI